MIPLFSAQHVATLDDALMDARQLSAYQLMCEAGFEAFKYLQVHWPQAQRVGILCGPGNNGGDGFVLARLARDAGFSVDLRAYAVSGPEAARQARADWLDCGGTISTDLDDWHDCDVYVDCLFGIGLGRDLQGEARDWVERLNDRSGNARFVPVLAIDVPSGLSADTGQVCGVAVYASRCLSFVAHKRGLFTGQARDYCAVVDLADLGANRLAGAQQAGIYALDARSLADYFPPRRGASHKGTHGRLAVIAGSAGFAGAGILCATAALRAGAGLAELYTDSHHAVALHVALPELIIHPMAAGQSIQSGLARADTVAVGPGLGTNEWGVWALQQALDSHKPMVIDADGLNLLGDGVQMPEQTVLTPHPGEAARLLGVTVAQIQADRFAAVDRLLQKFKCTVVLKGAGTLVAAPSRNVMLINAGNPGMAVAGMGDVLAGIIAAVLGQGYCAYEAAWLGALVHSVAADMAAEDCPRGLLASDLFIPIRRLVNP